MTPIAMADILTDNLKDYNVIHVINNGKHNTSYKVVHKPTGRVLVLQAIDYGYASEQVKKVLKSEIKLLANLNHPHVLRLLKCINYSSTNTLYIVTDYYEGGNIEQLIQKCQATKSFIPESFIWKLLYQLCRGLHALLSRLPNAAVLQYDVNPATIVLDANGNAKFCGLHIGLDSQRKVAPSSCSIGQLVAMIATLELHPLQQQLPVHYTTDLQSIVDMMLNQHLSMDAILYHPLVVSNVALNSLHGLSLEQKPELRDDHPASGRSSVNSFEDRSCLRCKNMEAKVEHLKQKEAALRCKEVALKDKEYGLNKREKQLAVLEQTCKEKIVRAEVYLSQCRRPRKLSIEDVTDINDSSYSADPGDTSVLPTASKINPNSIKHPLFLRNAPNRKTVHFDNEPVYASLQKQKCPSLLRESQGYIKKPSRGKENKFSQKPGKLLKSNSVLSFRTNETGNNVVLETIM